MDADRNSDDLGYGWCKGNLLFGWASGGLCGVSSMQSYSLTWRETLSCSNSSYNSAGQGSLAFLITGPVTITFDVC